QIGASGRVQGRELAAIDLDQIAPELVERRVSLAQDGVVPAQEMDDHGRRDGQLWREFGDRLEEREMLREDRARPFELVVDDQLLDRDRLALLVAMKELPLLRAQAARPQRLAEEIDQVVLAAEFTVADRAQPDGFLQGDDLANGGVLDRCELGAIDQL